VTSESGFILILHIKIDKKKPKHPENAFDSKPGENDILVATLLGTDEV